MIVRKNLKLTIVFRNTWKPMMLYGFFGLIAFFLYDVLSVESIKVPLAVSATLGTALAIIIGFRNNAAYDRWWEARKIWGGIVNASRTFARQVTTLLTMTHAKTQTEEALKEAQKTLVYQHLAWINALRIQLRGQDQWETDVKPYLSAGVYQTMITKQNNATQLLQLQGECIKDALDKGFIEDFRHMQFDNCLTEMTTLQGQAERIKNTPLARQYDYFPRIFMLLFIFLLPFGLVETFTKQGIGWMVVPLNMAIGFVFFVIGKIGEFNEDPFENRITDTPMTALCRTIEIDLREQLGETDLPPKLHPVDGFLF